MNEIHILFIEQVEKEEQAKEMVPLPVKAEIPDFSTQPTEAWSAEIVDAGTSNTWLDEGTVTATDVSGTPAPTAGYNPTSKDWSAQV